MHTKRATYDRFKIKVHALIIVFFPKKSNYLFNASLFMQIFPYKEKIQTFSFIFSIPPVEKSCPQYLKFFL